MSKSFVYRPDIDGLRAVAVLLVVFYHAGFTTIKGGFIGVDVFFVLSGFLITLILDREIRSGEFSFKKFYLRRIRRLLPALLFVLVVTSVFCFYYLVPGDLIAYGNSLRYALLSLSNVYFWLNTGSYFSKNVDELPLLHTWSLSVEEQFYFVWPVFLLAMSRFFSRTTTWVLFILGFFAAFGIADWAAVNKASAAYYFLPTRAYELMLGAGLALAWDDFPRLNARQNNLLSLVGLSMIIGTSLLLNKSQVFPGVNALWPCLGAALLIASGKHQEQAGIVNRILAIKLVVAIGLISYALYLWHWPILALINYQGIELTKPVASFAIGASVIMAVLSYFFIEKPFRTKLIFSFEKSFVIWLLIPLVVSVFGYQYVQGKDGFKERFENLFNPSNKVLPDLEKANLGKLSGSYLGVKKEKLDGLFIGDSMAGAYLDFVNVLAVDARLFIYGSHLSGLPPFLGQFDYPREDALETRTPDKLEQNELRIKEAGNYRFVILSASWANGFPYLGHSEDDINRTIEYYLNNKIKVIVLWKPNFFGGARIYNQAVAQLMRTKTLVDFKIKDQPTKIVADLKEKYPDIILINPNDVLCRDGECDVQIDGTFIYSDQAHLNRLGAFLLGEKYLKINGNPLSGL